MKLSSRFYFKANENINLVMEWREGALLCNTTSGLRVWGIGGGLVWEVLHRHSGVFSAFALYRQLYTIEAVDTV